MPALGRLRYLERAPEGRPAGTLVLLHAFPLNARMWEPQLALAEHGWRIIAPHMRGMDGATNDPDTQSIDDYTADVIDLLDALHLDEVVLCGLSMGGYLTFSILRHAPNYVRGLILADTRPQADTPEGIEGRKKMLALVAEKGVEAVADEMLPKLLGPTTRSTRREVVERVRALALSNSPGAVAGAIRAMMSRPDSTPMLGTIRLPTLIIVGDEDGITPPALSEDMHARVPGSELVRVSACGHLPSLERTDVFNSAIGQFLRRRV